MQEGIDALQEGVVLAERYRIVRILGEGGFGITYLAKDIQIVRPVVIKEYFPSEFALRQADGTVVAKERYREAFEKGLVRFQDEAKVLAKFNHPSIVKILDFFTGNGTSFFVMEYEEGEDLAGYMKRKKRFEQQEIFELMMPILEGLKEVHAHRFLHRDIKPSNILVRRNKPPVLIDFGASKEIYGYDRKTVTMMLTEGYAPPEQYSRDIRQQGPFSDLYAVAAVMYKMIVGKTPVDAMTRNNQLLQTGEDPLQALASLRPPGYDIHFLKAIDQAMALKAMERPRTIKDFQDLLVGKQPLREMLDPIERRAAVSKGEDRPAERTKRRSERRSETKRGGQVKAAKVPDVSRESRVPLFLSLAAVLIGGIVSYLYWFKTSAPVTERRVLNPTEKPRGLFAYTPRASASSERTVSATVPNQRQREQRVEARSSEVEKPVLSPESKRKVVTNHVSEAERLLKVRERDCSMGDAKACYKLAKEHLEGDMDAGVLIDFSKAFYYMDRSCHLESARACRELGKLYEDGKGVRRNDARAAEAYRQGCRQGDDEACVSLGFMYHKGKGVPKDYKKAFSLYKKACDEGYASGCVNLGYMYKYGQGVKGDDKKAALLYDEACRNDVAAGCTNLGLMYENGRGVKLNFQNAKRLYEMGCSNGHAKGCTNLGMLYEKGLGVEKDEYRALDYYRKGCDMYSAFACKKLKRLEKQREN